MIKVEVDKTVIEPDEIVTFTGYAEPVEDIIVDAYVEGRKVATYTIYIETLGINTLRIKPGMLGDVVEFRFTGKDSGETADPITITVEKKEKPSVALAGLGALALLLVPIALIAAEKRKSLPERGTGLRTGRAGERRAGKPRTEEERRRRHYGE